MADLSKVQIFIFTSTSEYQAENKSVSTAAIFSYKSASFSSAGNPLAERNERNIFLHS